MNCLNENNCRYCNYCKYFRSYGQTSLWITNKDGFGPGLCDLYSSHKYIDHKYFYMSCDWFCYDPLKNQYNLESPDYIKDWLDARKFQSDMYNDILDYKSKEYREREKAVTLQDYIEMRKRFVQRSKLKRVTNHDDHV